MRAATVASRLVEECHVWRIPLDGERDRERCRSATRDILSRYTDELVFQKGPQGKPCLTGPGAPRFNLSHTAGLALLAVSDSEVGVDVERVRGGLDPVRMARRFFSPGEAEAVRLGTAQLFFRLWVCKESYGKATGAGLRHGMPTAALSLGPDGAIRLSGGRWRLHELTPEPDCPAAVVVAADSGTAVRVLSWEGR